MAARLAAVTGATGFLGGYIVGALTAAGWRVRILNRRSGAPPRLAGQSFETVAGDLSNRDALSAFVDGADAVVHAAGLIKAPTLAAFRQANASGTANLVEALNEAGSAATTILVSSMVAREPSLSDYARSKREGEAAMAALRHDWTIMRPSAVYGPWDTETLAIFKAAASRVFPVPPRRDSRVALIHAADVAGAIAALCGAGPSASRPSGRIFELTDGRVAGYGWGEIVAALERAVAVKAISVPVPGFAVRAAAFANMAVARLAGRTPIFTLGKAREFLHADWGSAADRQLPPDLWRPAIGLDEGFRETAGWYRDRNWLRGAMPRPLAAGAVR